MTQKTTENVAPTLNSSWKLGDLLKGVIDVENEDVDITIASITLDSREVKKNTLFVALNGTDKHGLNFADKAIDKGAVAILWEPDAVWSQGDYSVPAIGVDDLRERLGIIVDRFYGSPSADMKVVGVTGTDGKSTVSHFIAEALNGCGQKSAVIGTLGVGVPGDLVDTGLTTPDVVVVHRTLAEFKQQGIKNVIMEVSSHALDQQRVAGVDFEVAVLTNLTRDHLDYHGTVEAYGEAKARLFVRDGLQSVVINIDDAFGQQLIENSLELENSPEQVNHSEQVKSSKQENKSITSSEGGKNRQADVAPQAIQAQVIAYSVAKSAVKSVVGSGVSPAECLKATNPQFTHNGIQADFHFHGDTKTVNAPVLGEFNLYNLLAATGCLIGMGLPFAKAVDCVCKVKTVPGRMEKVSSDGEPLVVVDYAHTPSALEAALKALRVHTPSRVVCVFGCGGDRDKGKRPLMARTAELNANMVILTDDNPRSEMPFQIMHDMISGLEHPEHVAMEHDRAKAIRYAVKSVESGDSVLIAGKGHETYQLVGDEKRDFDDRVEARAAIREAAL